jgi:hypothetical protein
MGLDMYAYAVENASGDFLHFDPAPMEIHYWRKHHDLHGWMERLYRAKGGAGDFNCVPLRLSRVDLDNLEHDIKNNKLATMGGFFRNFPPDDDGSIADDMRFIERARSMLDIGFAVYYDSWW